MIITFGLVLHPVGIPHVGGVAPDGVLAVSGHDVDLPVNLNVLLLFAVSRVARVALQTASGSAEEASDAAAARRALILFSISVLFLRLTIFIF